MTTDTKSEIEKIFNTYSRRLDGVDLNTANHIESLGNKSYVDSIYQLVVESQPKTTFLKTWLSIDMGAKIHFEPKGMWGHRIWQTPNAGDYICSGIKKIDGSESITDHYDYRFTKVGEGSVGDDYDDITLRGKDIKRWYDNGATGDIETPHGFFMFSEQSQLSSIGGKIE